jgi:hypothetical protein
VIKDIDGYTRSEISRVIQNFLICLETAGFAISHHVYFNFRDFDGEYNAVDALRYGISRAVFDMVPADFVVDVKELLQGWVGYSSESAPEAALAAVQRHLSVSGSVAPHVEQPNARAQGPVAPTVINAETLLRAALAVRAARSGRWDPVSAGVAPAHWSSTRSHRSSNASAASQSAFQRASQVRGSVASESGSTNELPAKGSGYEGQSALHSRRFSAESTGDTR